MEATFKRTVVQTQMGLAYVNGVIAASQGIVRVNVTTKSTEQTYVYNEDEIVWSLKKTAPQFNEGNEPDWQDRV